MGPQESVLTLNKLSHRDSRTPTLREFILEKHCEKDSGDLELALEQMVVDSCGQLRTLFRTVLLGTESTDHWQYYRLWRRRTFEEK